MIGLRSALLVVLMVAAAAVSLSACGSSSISPTSSTSSTATSTSAGSGGGVAAAQQKCLHATTTIQDPGARSSAEQVCDHISARQANVSTALSKARQACLTVVTKTPIDSIKQAAEAAQCENIAAH